VDLFVPSVEELLFMLRRERFDQLTARVGAAHLLEALSIQEIVSLADEALAMGTKVVLLKMGIRGLYLCTASSPADLGRGTPTDLAAWTNRQLWAPSFQPNAVASTVGTGDAAIAGFLAAMLWDRSPAVALNVAGATGACCVEVAGALGGVQPWDQTLARIEAGWARLPLDLEPFGWAGGDEDGVWRGPAEHSRARLPASRPVHWRGGG
jgi:sugar/nucleoside kinase (ribokinase family)